MSTAQPKQQRRFALTMQLDLRQTSKRTKGFLKLDDDVSTATASTGMLSDSGSLHGPEGELNFSPTSKQVQFDERRNTSYDNKHLCFEECKELLWHSSLDLKDFKSNTYAIAKDFLRSHPKGEKDSFSYQGTLSSAFDACCQCKDETEVSESVLPPNTENLLNQHMKDLPDLLGLERYLVRKITADKNMRRRMVMDAVLDIQLKSYQASDGFRVQCMEAIREASMEVSRPSRLLATQIAQSHAASAECWC